jgi:hypothetical protein
MATDVGVTTLAILKRAAVLLASPLPHPWACCEFDLGPYCPRCAVAKAKGDLTHDMAYDAHDWELMQASEAIAAVIGRDLTVLSQSEAIAVINTAVLNQLREPPAGLRPYGEGEPRW